MLIQKDQPLILSRRLLSHILCFDILIFFYHFRVPHILSRPTLSQTPNYINLAQNSNIKFIDLVKISLSFLFHVTAYIAAKPHFFDEHYHPVCFSLFILLGFKMVMVIHRSKSNTQSSIIKYITGFKSHKSPGTAEACLVRKWAFERGLFSFQSVPRNVSFLFSTFWLFLDLPGLALYTLFITADSPSIFILLDITCFQR